jgi:hypothetical protein
MVFFTGKKGTEKPIEIFVALFVILAVALVMLKLFQNQITEKQAQLTQFEQENKQKELMESATLYCKSKCIEASNDGCSLRSLASLCLAYGSDQIAAPDFLDLNQNQVMDYDTSKLAGVGMCEDAIPCISLVSTCCGRQLSGSSCKTILTQYWNSQGVSDVGCMIKNNVKKGTCMPTAGSIFWYSQAGFNDTVTCP